MNAQTMPGGVRTIPRGGLPVWVAPDPRTQPTTRAEPGLQVQILEYASGWAKIAFSNGWVGWVDARGLEPTATKSAVTPLPGIGVALILLGSFLPWVSANGDSLSAWDIPINSLIDHASTAEDPKTGLVLLVVLLAAVPYLTKRPFPAAVNLGLAGLAAATCVGTMSFINDLQVVDPGIGLFVTGAGAFLLAASSFVARGRAR